MNKMYLVFIGLFLLISACVSDQELDFSTLKGDPGYFVECYLKPGDIYKLSATKIQPIHEDYILDYSLEFLVTVDTINLVQGLYKEANSGYIFNYGHPFRFAPLLQKTVSLRVISPENDTITSTTTIPEDVTIEDAQLKDKNLSFSFNTSPDGRHNYYITSIAMYLQDTIDTESVFLDYGHIHSVQTEEFEFELKADDYNQVEINLKRVTRENFDYQISLWNANKANNDNLTFPSPLEGNLSNAMGIFTCYTEDTRVLHGKR
ncbi:MAG: DUF4249 family protein [Marinilabiliaceae bacterium]|nr:DUF4249 family protein [Marinilabiliaceae bacterium]